jgi:hypothetical protein
MAYFPLMRHGSHTNEKIRGCTSRHSDGPLPSKDRRTHKHTESKAIS